MAEPVAALIVRLGLVVLFFPFSALDKTFNFKAAVDQAATIFKPPALARATIFAGLAVEIFMPIGVLTGVADRMAALVLAGYCAMTAILFKPFWSAKDIWAKGDSQGRDLFWDFLKNLSLGAGFLLITAGTHGEGLRPFLAQPFASTHPYAAGGVRG